MVNHQFIRFLKDTLLGNTWLIEKMLDESPEFIAADNWQELAEKMNACISANLADQGT